MRKTWKAQIKDKMNKIFFITGGSRSGKSNFALKMASGFSGSKIYIATAEALDEEMKDRIARHKEERSDEWKTIEEPIKIPEIIKELKGRYNVLLLDCLTLWLSNLIIREDKKEAMKTEIEKFLDSLRYFKNPSASSLQSSLFIVSNEVGMGIVPENRLARMFRDQAGMLNQKVAEIADEVYFVVSGIPLRIKG